MTQLNCLKFMSFAMSMIILALVLCNCFADASPMLYKKNVEDKYEADLVPVSSTVIPLSVLEVSYGVGGKPSEEYKKAYLKKLRKKVQKAAASSQEDNPDTLITVKNKNDRDANADGSKAKVKGIVTSN